MKRPRIDKNRLKAKFSRDRLKVDKAILTFVLTIAVIFMAGFAGVLTGFDILVKPKLEMAATTTTSSTTSTIPVTTSTTTTTVVTTSTTTTPSDPCSPCFGYFKYMGHNDQFLSIKNGPRTVKITKASQTGGSMNPDFNMNYVYPDQLMVFSSSFSEGTEVTIEYVDITSGNANRDSATLY